MSIEVNCFYLSPFLVDLNSFIFRIFKNSQGVNSFAPYLVPVGKRKEGSASLRANSD